jgi:hypothetical protein
VQRLVDEARLREIDEKSNDSRNKVTFSECRSEMDEKQEESGGDALLHFDEAIGLQDEMQVAG